MPKVQKRLALNLNLLHPQSNAQPLAVKLTKWLLSTGRFIFVLVEALVLITFIGRFKLDADIASKKEAIEDQIPYIESLRPYEIIIRQTQLKLSTLDTVRLNSVDFSALLKKIADQTPTGVKISSINLSNSLDKTTVNIAASSQTNNDLTSFLNGLKADQTFSDVNLLSVGLEEGNLHFTIAALAKKGKGKNL